MPLILHLQKVFNVGEILKVEIYFSALELYFFKRRQRRYALYFQKIMYIRECYDSTLASVTLVP